MLAAHDNALSQQLMSPARNGDIWQHLMASTDI